MPNSSRVALAWHTAVGNTPFGVISFCHYAGVRASAGRRLSGSQDYKCICFLCSALQNPLQHGWGGGGDGQGEGRRRRQRRGASRRRRGRQQRRPRATLFNCALTSAYCAPRIASQRAAPGIEPGTSRTRSENHCHSTRKPMLRPFRHTQRQSVAVITSRGSFFLAHFGSQGLLRGLNPGPLAPEARIMPLDQAANCCKHTPVLPNG